MDETECPNRRERKKQATRQALHQAAAALIAEHGLAGVTIEAITERADVAPRTFFNYFSSKEEAALGKDTDQVERLCLALEMHLQAAGPFDALHRTLRDDLAARATSGEDFWRRQRLITAEPGLMAVAMGVWQALEEGLRRVLATHLGLDPEHDLYPALLVSAAGAAGRVSFQIWSAEGCTRPLTDIVDEAFVSLAAGLPAPPQLHPVAAGP